jgi:hypothetical protein
MSEEKPRFPREIAIGVARELRELLKPVRSRLIVAGSLRKRQASKTWKSSSYHALETHQIDIFSCESISLAEQAVGNYSRPAQSRSAA